MSFTEIRRLKLEEVGTLEAAMKEDGHGAMAPTHVITNELKECIGSISLGVLPCALLWMHTKRAKVRDSLDAVRFIENLVAHTSPGVIVPCSVESPLYKYLPKIGYTSTPQDFKLFIKRLN